MIERQGFLQRPAAPGAETTSVCLLGYAMWRAKVGVETDAKAPPSHYDLSNSIVPAQSRALQISSTSSREGPGSLTEYDLHSQQWCPETSCLVRSQIAARAPAQESVEHIAPTSLVQNPARERICSAIGAPQWRNLDISTSSSPTITDTSQVMDPHGLYLRLQHEADRTKFYDISVTLHWHSLGIIRFAGAVVPV
ncbi:hypothetical protein BJ546DRAFT_208054 [Cryomyces antarcticus]